MPPFEKSMILQFGAGLGAVRFVAVARLLRRHHRRSREAGLCHPARQAGAAPGAAPQAGLVAASRNIAADHAFLSGPFAFDGGLLMKRPAFVKDF